MTLTRSKSSPAAKKNFQKSLANPTNSPAGLKSPPEPPSISISLSNVKPSIPAAFIGPTLPAQVSYDPFEASIANFNKNEHVVALAHSAKHDAHRKLYEKELIACVTGPM